jgi:hypothetical protein
MAWLCSGMAVSGAGCGGPRWPRLACPPLGAQLPAWRKLTSARGLFSLAGPRILGGIIRAYHLFQFPALSPATSRIAERPWVEDEQDADLAAPAGTGPEFL